MGTINADPGTYVVNERPLTDDELDIAPDGHVFPGGYVAILTFHTFQNSQSDQAHRRGFRTLEAAAAELVRRYGKTFDELVYGGDDTENDD